MQLHARLLLQLVNHGKQIARLGIASWTKYSHPALRRSSGGGVQFFEANGRLDVVAQNSFTVSTSRHLKKSPR